VYIITTIDAECSEADKDGAIRQRGGGANLVLLLHNPLAMSLGEESPEPLKCPSCLMANHTGLPSTS
jgi:hypothetical protein